MSSPQYHHWITGVTPAAFADCSCVWMPPQPYFSGWFQEPAHRLPYVIGSPAAIAFDADEASTPNFIGVSAYASGAVPAKSASTATTHVEYTRRLLSKCMLEV